MPSPKAVESANDRVPAGSVGRRLLGICRLVDWVVARGEAGLGDAAQAAAQATKPAPPAPAPMPSLGAKRGGVGGGVLPAVDNAAALAAAAAEVARLNEAARAARKAVTAAEAAVKPVMEAKIVAADGDETDKENNEPVVVNPAPTTTPAGFEMKGSNPLFEDSIDVSMDVDA